MRPEERRRYVRLAASDTVRCSVEGADVVHVVGLSSGCHGMRAITDHELPAEGDFAVELELDDEHPTISVRGHLVWQEAWDFGFCNRYVAGVEFLDIDDHSRSRLQALIPAKQDRQPLEPDEL